MLLFSSISSTEKNYCDDLKFSIEVTHTTNGTNNATLEITVIKSASKVKAYLYGDTKSKNKLNVELTELTDLPSGKYILVLQNNKCSSVKRDIIIK